MEKSEFIKEKIAEIRAKLAKPITHLQTGGFRPTGEKTESWIGRVFLCKPDEAKPIFDNKGKPLYALAQFYLPNLPFVPEPLKHITWLTVFMCEEFPEIEGQYGIEKIDEDGEAYFELHSELGQNGDGWLIKEYTADDELVEYEFEPFEFIKPFPLKADFKDKDFPLWDGGGVPSDLQYEISELEDDYDEENDDDKDDCDMLNYYDDIVGDDHCYMHKFGGYPSFCQSGVSFGENYEFMFQISSDGKANFNVVDGGSLMFARNDKGDWSLYYDFY